MDIKTFEIIVDYGKNKSLAENIKTLGSIKYDLHSINSLVMEIPKENMIKFNKIAFKTSNGIYKPISLNAQMNAVTQTLGVDELHQKGITGKNISIAVLDTGISPINDFILPKNRVVAFKDFVNNIPYPYDDNGHGSHVSGVCSGNGYLSNGRYAGISPESNIVALKILDKRGQGNSPNALAGIQWIIDNKEKYNIKIANLSIGSSEKNINPPLIKALEAAWDSGITVVVAAGNHSSQNNSLYRKSTSKIIIVDSLPYEKSSEYKNRADIFSYGTNIISCLSPNYYFNTGNRSRTNIVDKNYIKMSGTSMSTPIVSGVAALLLQRYPSLTPDEIKKLLILSSSPHGVLNIENLF